MLQAAGFTGIRNLNRGVNFPYADIIASEAGKTYFIGVKARNEFRDIGPLNSSYNAVKIRDSKNRELKALGKTEANITSIVWGGG